MKSFNFKSAANIREATKMASGRTTFLAGGMTLLPAMKLRLAAYSDLINIKKIKALSGIKVSSKSLRIGATTTHADVATSKEVGKSIPSLAVLAEGIGDPQVRNRGTIGGSIANNDPAADYPSACLALNATIHTSKRKIQADKFFKGMFETDLKKGELIEAIEFKVPDKSSYVKFPNPASRYAIVGIYVAKLKKEEIQNDRAGINKYFTVPLIFAAALLSFAHGANDVANAVGPLAAIADAVMNGGISPKSSIPFWVMAIGAIGNTIFVNQQTASVTSIASSHNNRVDFQNMLAQELAQEKEKKVFEEKIVVCENVNNELLKVAKEYDLPLSSLDFDVLNDNATSIFSMVINQVPHPKYFLALLLRFSHLHPLHPRQYYFF